MQAILRPKKITAPRPIIEVTQEDIDQACRGDSLHCMIERAIERNIPSAIRIIVDIQTIRWSDKSKGLRYTYFTPAKVIAILVAWDEGIKPAPFSFELRGPQITTMRLRENPRAKLKLAHKLGQKKRVAPKKTAMRATVVGGRPPPITRFSYSNNRTFGSRKLAGLIGARSLLDYVKDVVAESKSSA